MHLDGSPAEPQAVPPFHETKPLCPLVDARGSRVHPKLTAKIDKGFFKAEHDWTCYRRNYFSVACCYAFEPNVDPVSDALFVQLPGSAPEQVHGFSICIAAKVNGEDGKSIELVQHTPKRDKGPMTAPKQIELLPNPTANLGTFNGSSPGFGSNAQLADFDQSYHQSSSESQTMATFDRIQFKKATANNGKRRAAQQYFHIVVELFAKLARGKQAEWIKIAVQISAQMVVRGRSPGHYQDEKRGSSSGMGPAGGSGGDFGSCHRDPNSSNGSAGSHGSMSAGSFPNNCRLGSGSYQNHRHTPSSQSPALSHAMSASSSSSFGSNAGHLTARLDPTSHPDEPTGFGDHGYRYLPGSSLRAPSSGGQMGLHDATQPPPFRYDPRTEPPYDTPATSPVHHDFDGTSVLRPIKPELRRPMPRSTAYPPATATGAHWTADCRPFRGSGDDRQFYVAAQAL
jgi:meiosis-specific transcription factor NDT80